MKFFLVVVLSCSPLSALAGDGDAPTLAEQRQALWQLTADRPESVMAKLLQLRDRPASTPRVTLHLKSGRDLEGFIIDVSAKAVLLERAAASNQDVSAIYVDLVRIEAVTIHEAGAIALHPSFAPPAPTKAEVVKRAEELGKAVSQASGTRLAFEIVWRDVPESAESNRVLVQAMQQTANALREIASDDEGKDALKKLRRASFAFANEAKASVTEATVWVKATATPTGKRWLTAEELQRVLERSL